MKLLNASPFTTPRPQIAIPAFAEVVKIQRRKVLMNIQLFSTKSISVASSLLFSYQPRTTELTVT